MTINPSKSTIINRPALVAEFYKSGLKARVFCSQKDITYHQLQYWRKICKSKNKANELTEPKFLPINLEQPISKSVPIKIIINSKISIELPTEVDLLRLKKVLEVCLACG
jgi:hypothetical protein